MSERRIKVAFVKFTEEAKKAYMFEYGDAYIRDGDTVIVMDAAGNEQEATVVDTDSYDLDAVFDKKELNKLLMVAGVNMPFRKIKGRVTREYFNNEEKKDEE